jgi:hypothetical protein
MILFNQLVQVSRRPQFHSLAAPMFAEKLPGRAIRRLLAVECDGSRRSALALERSAKKSFRCGDIPLCAQQKIDGLSVTINSAIQIGPGAFVKCARSGRLADMAIDERLLVRLKSGKVATLITYPTPYEGVRRLLMLRASNRGMKSCFDMANATAPNFR